MNADAPTNNVDSDVECNEDAECQNTDTKTKTEILSVTRKMTIFNVDSAVEDN